MIKDYLIAVDLDGTLITGYNNMDMESFDKLKELSKDNKIVIATGRPNRSSIDFYNYLGINTLLVNYNGAWVHNPTDDSFTPLCTSMKKEFIFDMIDDNSDIITNIFSEVGDDVYLDNYNPVIKPFLHEDGATIHLGPLKENMKHDPAGAILIVKDDGVERLQKYVDEKFKGKALLRFWQMSNPCIAEFYTPEISKGAVLEYIREYYHIDKEKTIAFGDGHNDIDMLNFAHYGVAMGNSHPALMIVAKYHTESVYEHGVKAFLERLEKGEVK